MSHYYLASKMRGIQGLNFKAFFDAEEKLAEFGHTCFNPARHELEGGFDAENGDPKTIREYMRVDLPQVLESDGVVLIHNEKLDPIWQSSQGANIEVFVALSCGVPVLDFPDLTHILQYPPFDAFWTCQEVMVEGLGKHKKNSWLFENPNNHALKSARHSTTYVMIKDGHSKPDGEDHSRYALCRAAMLVSQKKLAAMESENICGV